MNSHDHRKFKVVSVASTVYPAYKLKHQLSVDTGSDFSLWQVGPPPPLYTLHTCTRFRGNGFRVLPLAGASTSPLKRCTFRTIESTEGYSR